jgi:hypothetical protein
MSISELSTAAVSPEELSSATAASEEDSSPTGAVLEPPHATIDKQKTNARIKAITLFIF